MEQQLDKITQEEFEKIKASCLSNYERKELSQKEVTASHWKFLDRRSYRFNWKEIMANKTKEMTLDQVKAFFKKIFREERKVIEVHLICKSKLEKSRQLREERLAKNDKLRVTNDPKEFRKKTGLFSDPWSYEK